MTDPIADLIIQIKNAGSTGKEVVVLPYSNIKFAILDLLKKENFIKDFHKKGKKVIKSIEIELLYEGKLPKIKGVKRVSKTSKRIYKKSTELYPIKNGYGILVLSTPKGIMSNKMARKEKIGGEALFTIW